jgi:cytochrome oxidase Cu insertion factor (SCO1/SenC/PrrC family)
MTCRRAIALVLLGLGVVVGAIRVEPASSEPAVEAAVWRAAGITPALQPVWAQAFQLGDLSGNRVDLEQFRGQLVMLYFWATW